MLVLVPVTVETWVPFWKTRYWIVQLGPAVEALQLSVTVLDVTFEALSPPGTLGITVHPPDPEQAPRLVHGCPLPGPPLWVAGFSFSVHQFAW
jgi:hypothetical protein